MRPWEGQCLRAIGAGVRVRGREREQEPASRWGEVCKGKWGLAQAWWELSQHPTTMPPRPLLVTKPV